MTDRFSPEPRKGKHQRILIMSGQASNLPSGLKLVEVVLCDCLMGLDRS